MSKELEALNKIQHDFGQLKGQELVNCYETIFNGLKRLEAIENSNPSEAMGCLHWMGKHRIEFSEFLAPIEDISEYKTIKNYILKAQEQEKVLEIIKEKRVDLCILTDCDNVNEYNKSLGNFRPAEDRLTYEEFELLKRYFK